MKKLIIAILAVLYLGTSLGATIHMHYCMGKLADWSFRQSTSESCSLCGMEKKDSKGNGCCQDEHKFYKDDTAQKVTVNNLQMMQLFSTALPASFIMLPDVAFTSLTEENPNSHAPPRSCEVPIYKRNCVFRI